MEAGLEQRNQKAKMGEKIIRVMLADDHAVVRAGLMLLLEQSQQLEVVGVVESGEEACQQYRLWRPDVLVMDINMPGLGGLAATRRICGYDPAAKILVFSAFEETDRAFRALEAGAAGFIGKSADFPELLQAILTVAKGKAYAPPHLAPALTLQAAEPLTEAERVKVLTQREYEVFCLLAQGFSCKEAARELRLEYKTVANRASMIRHKLNVSTTEEMAGLARLSGIFK
jgi:DNA-binding NarL/FixJ family response regulator